MARRIKIASGVLNVRTHPHSAERYAELFKRIFEQKNVVKVRGDRYAMISLIDTRSARQGHITGLLATFLNVETEGQWFDTRRLSEAKAEDVREIKIPENLRPNLATFRLYFDLNDHRLYFQTYSEGKQLTPYSALRVFSALVDDLKIRNEFGDVKVTLVQSKSSLDTLFALKLIKEVIITIEQPNSDIFADDFEDKIEKHLEESNSRQVTIAYRAESGQSITPTKDIKDVSRVALENGRVEVRGRDEKGATVRSSENHPRVLQDKYDPDETTEEAAFRSLIPRKP